MYKCKRIAVIVPARNEAELIGGVVRTIPPFVDFVVVVDDASMDDTAKVAQEAGDSRLTVLKTPEPSGVGGAIIAGHRRAVELGSEINVVMAGDGQMDPRFLPNLLDPLIDEGFGLAKANRFFSMRSFAGMPRHRIWGNILVSFLMKLASGYWHIFDPQNGYTAITRSVLERLPLDDVARGYEFENDLLINLNILRIPVCDVPIPAKYGKEVSGIRLRSLAPATARLLLKGFWKRVLWKYVLSSFSPIALFLFAGLALISFGFLFGIWVLVQTIGPEVATTGTVILSVVPFLVGTQLIISALALDIEESSQLSGKASTSRP